MVEGRAAWLFQPPSKPVHYDGADLGVIVALADLLCDAFVTLTGLFIRRGAPALALNKNSPSMLHGKEN
jgi:hypothetical protein